MLAVILALLHSLLSGFQSHFRLVLENLALRHQLAVLKRQTRKPKLRPADRLLWVGRNSKDCGSSATSYRSWRAMEFEIPLKTRARMNFCTLQEGFAAIWAVLTLLG
jgi:hypothetical protein